MAHLTSGIAAGKADDDELKKQLSVAIEIQEGGPDEEFDANESRSHWEKEQLRQDLELVAQSNTTTGLTSAQVLEAREKWGYNELAETHVSPFIKFLGYFKGPMPIMIWIAIIIELARSIAQGDPEGWADFGVLLILQIINGTVGFIEEHNAGNAIAALKEQLAPKSFTLRDGAWESVPARELVPGDVIQLKLGDIVPADAILLGKGEDCLEVDQAALTGESLPVTIYHHEKVKMGSSVKRGELNAIVCGTGENTFFGKAAGMIASVDEIGHFQRILFRITSFLLAISIVLCIIILIYLLVRKEKALDAIAVVVVLLVASIPIAMQVVCTSTMAIGARRLAQRKVIVARLSAIEELAGMSILCSDKTGTLTKNKLELRPPMLFSEMLEEDLFFYSALAAKRVRGNQDAIDLCICDKVRDLNANNVKRLEEHEELDFMPFNPTDKRTEATVVVPGSRSATDDVPAGNIMKITKGAPQVVLRLVMNDEKCPLTQEERTDLQSRVSASIQELADRGFRALGVAVKRSVGAYSTEQLDKIEFSGWNFEGLLSLFDPPREDTKATIAEAVASGVEVKMVTGDQTAIAKETCRELEMGTNILDVDVLRDQEVSSEQLEEIILNANGFAEVMPEDKFDIVNALRRQGLVVGMTGDGVNDAPALKRADIGIAVEGATDAARAAADIVLTEPGLSVITEAMQRSRKIFQRMRNYCIYRIACTVELLFFFFIAILACNPEIDNFYGPHDTGNAEDNFYNFHPRTFTLPVIALVIITILNDGTIITIARDKVIPEKRPQKWELKEVVVIASVQGLIACLGSIILIVVCFQASLHNGDGASSSITYMFGEERNGKHFVPFSAVQTLIYLKISLSDFLTVFSARTRGFFWERRPGLSLSIACLFATTVSTILAAFWPFHGSFPIDCPADTSEVPNPHHYCHSMVALQDVGNARGIGFVWIFSIINFIVQDTCKVLTYWVLRHLDTAHRDRLDDMSRKAIAGRAAASYDRVARQQTQYARDASIMRQATSAAPSRHTSISAARRQRTFSAQHTEAEVNTLVSRVGNLENQIERLQATISTLTDQLKTVQQKK